MAQCIRCDKKGLFLKVDKNKLCNNCSTTISMEVNRHLKIIDESVKIANNTKNSETRIGRIDDIINNLQELKKYQVNGIDLNLNFNIDENIQRHIDLKKETVIIASGKYKELIEKLENALNAHENGILMEYEVLDSNDERVCSKCKEFNGYTASVIDAKIGINHPPFHDGCRCFAAYSIAGIKK